MKDDKDKRYSITNLTSDQLFIIIKAVESCSRVNAGQVEEAFSDIRWNSDRIIKASNEGRLWGGEFFDDIKRKLFPELSVGASYGVGNADKDDKLGILRQRQYEIYRQLRYLHTKENREEKDGYSVYDSPGLRYSKDELVGLEINDDTNQ